MLDTLQKMSGTTHKVYRDGKQVTRDMEKLILQNEGKVSISLSVKEQPVIAYNDLAFMPMCNSIVFRAGDSPIWNRNQTCLPMSYRLFKNTIIQPGKEYSLQTVPSLSSAADFDVRKNMPNFEKMWDKRYRQSLEVASTIEAYKKAYGYDDDAIARLDPDKYADEIMAFVNQRVAQRAAEEEAKKAKYAGSNQDGPEPGSEPEQHLQFASNTALEEAQRQQAAMAANWAVKRYCSGTLSPEMLCPMPSRVPDHKWDDEILSVFLDERVQDEIKKGNTFDDFQFGPDGSIINSKGAVLIQRYSAELQNVEVNAINKQKAAEMAARNIEMKEEKFQPDEHDGWKVQDALYHYLVSLSSWDSIANGIFEEVFTEVIRGRDVQD